MANAADRRQVKKASQRERLRRQRELADLATVLSTKQGRRRTWAQLQQTGVFRQSFIPGEPSEVTAFNEGRRSIGLALMADVHALDPELYLTMAKEAKEDEQKQQPEPDTEPADDNKPTDEEEPENA